ncbi:MAG: hypothetical protein M3Q55_08930 [Acidobacteriota bacterium]|nr:hypothetical protein [Acidobacteriota bacterium]
MTRAHTILRVVVIVACLCSALARPSAFQDPDKPTPPNRLAVVRADGTIVPFAQYKKGRWPSIWTGIEQRGHPLPLTVADVERDWWGDGGPALQWWLWQKPGIATRLDVADVRAVATPCSAEAGLATDFRGEGALPSAEIAPYPKAGFASTAPVDFEPIVPVPATSAEWASVKDAVAREFDGHEVSALVEMAWSHPTPARERRMAPLDLQTVWHVPGGRFFYFEAMRRYPERETPDGKPPCDLVTYVAGYLWDDGKGQLRPRLVNALVSYCHLERAVFMWPLGSIREGVRRFWVLQSAGWTGEAYGILEMRPERGEIRQHLWHMAGRCDAR